jgi:hypothetical protein
MSVSHRLSSLFKMSMFVLSVNGVVRVFCTILIFGAFNRFVCSSHGNLLDVDDDLRNACLRPNLSNVSGVNSFSLSVLSTVLFKQLFFP